MPFSTFLKANIVKEHAVNKKCKRLLRLWHMGGCKKGKRSWPPQYQKSPFPFYILSCKLGRGYMCEIQFFHVFWQLCAADDRADCETVYTCFTAVSENVQSSLSIGDFFLQSVVIPRASDATM